MLDIAAKAIDVGVSTEEIDKVVHEVFIQFLFLVSGCK